MDRSSQNGAFYENVVTHERCRGYYQQAQTRCIFDCQIGQRAQYNDHRSGRIWSCLKETRHNGGSAVQLAHRSGRRHA